MIKCIHNGFIAGEIMNAAYEAQMKIEKKEAVVVGVNKYTESEKNIIPTNKISASVEVDQVKKLKAFKANRDKNKVHDELNKLKVAAQGSDNLMPFIKSCMKNNCTLGEVSLALKDIFGTYRPSFKF